jgi:hypothetical protein
MSLVASILQLGVLSFSGFVDGDVGVRVSGILHNYSALTSILAAEQRPNRSDRANVSRSEVFKRPDIRLTIVALAENCMAGAFGIGRAIIRFRFKVASIRLR